MEDKNYPPPFQWVEFPEGRARFSGSIRGWDEQGHESFSLSLNGRVFFGEIKDIWEKPNIYNLAVESFGYTRPESVGIPIKPGNPFLSYFSQDDVEGAKSLIVKLIEFHSGQDKKPSVMYEDNDVKFGGKIIFSPEWVIVNEPAEEAGDL